MKFKVGDRVRVVDAIYDFKKVFIGNEYVVRSINPNGPNWCGFGDSYGVEGLVYILYDCELELVKPKFDHNHYRYGRYAMYCKTYEDAVAFAEYVRSRGGYIVDADIWSVYRDKTCFNVNANLYCSVEHYETGGYTILEFEDFDWSDFTMKKKFTKKDLRNGDVVKCRNGEVAIVCVDTNALVFQDGYLFLGNLRDDLTHGAGLYQNDNYTIMAVRRPLAFDDCYFSAFELGKGKLVFERKEVEEMTLEEVCKALGKEIKIVKK